MTGKPVQFHYRWPPLGAAIGTSGDMWAALDGAVPCTRRRTAKAELNAPAANLDTFAYAPGPPRSPEARASNPDGRLGQHSLRPHPPAPTVTCGPTGSLVQLRHTTKFERSIILGRTTHQDHLEPLLTREFNPSPIVVFDLPTGRYIPDWQYLDGEVLPGLADVLDALAPDMGPVDIDLWCNTPDLELVIKGQPVTPLGWLAAGRRAAAVVASAKATRRCS